MKRVVVGLSGGVDSSVAAYLLKEEGYEVIGMFMKNWHDESVTISDDCPWIDDSNDALMVAEALEIPFQVIDLSKPYKERIVDYMFNEYQQGRTPNPDVLCNKEIKFDVFLKAAMDLGADFVATGHYCQKKMNADKEWDLIAGADPTKDQSYFLCQISQKQLAKALFPIGHLLKTEVRELAGKMELVTAEKKDSQGLCFVGKIKLPDFLQQKLASKKGPVIEIPNDMGQYHRYKEMTLENLELEMLCKPFSYRLTDGIRVSTHQGAHFYTIGQRKGLHIGGRPLPSFVIGTDTTNNIVYSGQTDDHPGLNRIALKVEKDSVNWISRRSDVEDQEYEIRIRYRQNLQKGRLIQKEGSIYVLFEDKQKGISPGQFVAWYNKGVLVGSGVIES
ncbi:MAG: tRNA 2-thiouridine(34) synthase MnmA [Crocinitomicaceae bacterium]|tara:strand:- start:1181 stop:2350 length:1170 start_codon:yes stop_codon:yes gene_type:complete